MFCFISAAHCYQAKLAREPRKASSLIVIMGKANLSSVDETHVIESLVSEIIIHPDWEYETRSYDADIAVLKLETSIVFNPNVKSIKWQPSCHDFVRIGYAVSFTLFCSSKFWVSLRSSYKVGWGRSEKSNLFDHKDHEKMSKQILLNAVSNEDCFIEFNQIASFASRRTFCAGWPGHEANVCTGDSGSGFYVKTTSNEWILQGIVSSADYVNNTCIVNAYSVFTKVFEFSNWIAKVTEPSDLTSKNFKGIDVQCKFLKWSLLNFIDCHLIELSFFAVLKAEEKLATLNIYRWARITLKWHRWHRETRFWTTRIHVLI